MRSPTVSGAQSYPELCLAVRQEEKRVAELRRRQQYTRNTAPSQNKKKQGERTLPKAPALTPEQGRHVTFVTPLITLHVSVSCVSRSLDLRTS